MRAVRHLQSGLRPGWEDEMDQMDSLENNLLFFF